MACRKIVSQHDTRIIVGAAGQRAQGVYNRDRRDLKDREVRMIKQVPSSTFRQVPPASLKEKYCPARGKKNNTLLEPVHNRFSLGTETVQMLLLASSDILSPVSGREQGWPSSQGISRSD